MKNVDNTDDLRPAEVNNRINARWTNEETMLAVNGVKQFGKDFQVGCIFYILFFFLVIEKSCFWFDWFGLVRFCYWRVI